jgi:hypothetical protein
VHRILRSRRQSRLVSRPRLAEPTGARECAGPSPQHPSLPGFFRAGGSEGKGRGSTGRLSRRLQVDQPKTSPAGRSLVRRVGLRALWSVAAAFPSCTRRKGWPVVTGALRSYPALPVGFGIVPFARRGSGETPGRPNLGSKARLEIFSVRHRKGIEGLLGQTGPMCRSVRRAVSGPREAARSAGGVEPAKIGRR